MIPAYYTLIAALIGGIVALASQFLSSFLTSKREQKKAKRELVAEERCLAFLLSQYYSVYVGELIITKYFVRFAAIEFQRDNEVDNSMLYKSGNDALERAAEVDEKIRVTTANYFKVITHFTNLTKKREEIISLFDSMKSFERPQPYFLECKTEIELDDAKDREKSRLREAYKRFPETYNKIFEEMKKSI